MMAALALCSVANSQEVMKLELKNGQVVTYPVENISRFYFEGEQPQQPQLAENCELGIADEVNALKKQISDHEATIWASPTRWCLTPVPH